MPNQPGSGVAYVVRAVAVVREVDPDSGARSDVYMHMHSLGIEAAADVSQLPAVVEQVSRLDTLDLDVRGPTNLVVRAEAVSVFWRTVAADQLDQAPIEVALDL